MFKIDDLVTLAKAGWTPKQCKEVLEMISTLPAAKQDAAPEELKAKAEIKEVEELPKVEEKEPLEDPVETLKKLLMED